MRNSSSLRSKLLICFVLLSFTTNIRSQVLQETRETRLERDFASLINRPGICEAYPYLSADGLRLYFTSDREGGFGRIYYCSRNSVGENFSEPLILSKNITDGYYCATFTADELTMYMAMQGEIYVSKRKGLASEFSKPEMVKGLVTGFKYAPAISPEGNELIMIRDSFQNNDVTYVYKKINEKEFVRTGSLSLPIGRLTPGQFSKDGLIYYAAYEISNSKKTGEIDQSPGIEQIMIKYTRKALGDKFEEIQELPAAANPAKRNHQPTVNGDGSIMIIVNTEKNEWKYNELRLIHFEIDEEIEIVDTLVQECSELPMVEIKVDTIPGIFLDTTLLLESFWECQKIIYEDVIIVADTIFCHFGGEGSCDGGIEVTNMQIEMPEFAPQVKVYPNPFINNLAITIANKDVNSNFELYDISGRRIMTTKLNNTINRIQFNKPGAGAYFYNIRALDGRVISTGKLLKK